MAVKMTEDNLDAVLKSFADLAAQYVVVGVTSDKTERKEDGQMTNAQIAYVQETGSAANNLPARPFLGPGVAGASDAISKQLGQAGELVLKGKGDEARHRLERAGMIGANAAKAKMQSNIPPPLAPGTVEARARQRRHGKDDEGKRKPVRRRKGEKAYLAMIDAGAQAAGVSLAEIQSAAGLIPLINTGELRNAITYAVRRKNKG